MTKKSPPRVILCNGASIPDDLKRISEKEPLTLEYRSEEGYKANLKISLPKFVRSISHLPPRILDLLEISAYVFVADRYH